jgi:flagellar basal body-associated protein FliL
VIVVLILALAGATAWYFFRFRPQDAAAQKSPTHQNPVVSETAERVFSGAMKFSLTADFSIP